MRYKNTTEHRFPSPKTIYCAGWNIFRSPQSRGGVGQAPPVGRINSSGSQEKRENHPRFCRRPGSTASGVRPGGLALQGRQRPLLALWLKARKEKKGEQRSVGSRGRDFPAQRGVKENHVMPICLPACRLQQLFTPQTGGGGSCLRSSPWSAGPSPAGPSPASGEEVAAWNRGRSWELTQWLSVDVPRTQTMCEPPGEGGGPPPRHPGCGDPRQKVGPEARVWGYFPPTDSALACISRVPARCPAPTPCPPPALGVPSPPGHSALPGSDV